MVNIIIFLAIWAFFIALTYGLYLWDVKTSHNTYQPDLRVVAMREYRELR